MCESVFILFQGSGDEKNILLTSVKIVNILVDFNN